MEDWIIVVDDDPMNLRLASKIFGEAKMRASYFRSGKEMLDFLDGEKLPDLILLDVHMPDMDGFEVLSSLRANSSYEKVPVIFLTADDDIDTETRGLNAGASDFIKKPFAAKILLTRVRNTIALSRVQLDMERALAEQADRLYRVYIQVVMSMSMAIDAKGTYTNGHSSRVAMYSKMIASRAGYSAEALNDIYMMGLLHDVGKIGVPDEIINKPGKLTDDEFDIIKKHPVIGGDILKNISEFPELYKGARWHHERYDGKGYPDGLMGDEIPEVARIIAVADTYDAMTSKRSYRDPLPQDYVRSEFIKCKGTQFDPRFADIMIELIDEDTDYHMKEEK